MNNMDMAKLVDSLSAIASLFERIGLPGLVVLLLLGPAMVLCAVLLVEYHRSHRVQEIVEAARSEGRSMMEIYRADTQRILRELGTGIEQNVRFYRDNVDLVKQYDFLAKNLQDVVVSNTRATERLIVMLEERRKQG